MRAMDEAPPLPPALERQTTEAREQFLIDYSTQRAEERAEISLTEGWEICREYGVDVLTKHLMDGMVDRNPFGNRGYTSLYSISFMMTAQANTPDQSRPIYDNVGNVVETFLKDKVIPQLLDTQLVGTPLIRHFSKSWENHKILTKWMKMLFLHIDVGYVTNNNVATLTSLCLSKFLNVAFGQTCERVRQGVMELINSERAGNQIDREQIKSCIEVFVVMGLTQINQNIRAVSEISKMPPRLEVYETEFETFFLDASHSYYDHISSGWRDELSVADYLERCETVLREEKNRVHGYLHPSTERRLLLRVEEVLLSVPQADLVNRTNGGMYSMLVEERDDDLARMFRLFTREGVKDQEAPMTVLFEKFVHDQGMALLKARQAEVQRLEAEGKKETTADPTMIIAMIALYRKTEQRVQKLFGNHLNFHKAMRNAFQGFVNQTATPKYSNADLLVAYCDALLKGKERSEKLDENSIEERLEGAMHVFYYLNDKDDFAALYRDYLSKRLLGSKFASMEMEKAMITKLKQNQGPPFTAKIEGMVQDHQMIRDVVRGFEEHCEKSAVNLPLPASVQELTVGWWPQQPAIKVNLPKALGDFTQIYEKYFKDRTSGNKRLAWIFALGDAEVVGTFPKGKKYTIAVTTLQAVALDFLGGQNTPISCTQIMESLGTDIETTKRVLHSLSCGKHKVIQKSGPGGKGKINEEDVFTPSSEFQSKLRKFQIPMASLDNIGQIKAKVREDRSFAIDAALVRIMKARKRLGHQELVGEVVAQLTQFKPEVSQVKNRIGSLLEREYLKRVEDSQGDWTREYDYQA